MTNELQPVPPLFPDPRSNPGTMDIETYSYAERRVIFPAITEALEFCGCWLLDRRPLSFTQVEFRFELPLRTVVELYAALIAAGLELTRTSHEELITLCTLRQHQDYPSCLPGVITVRLEVSFLEDGSTNPDMSIGTANA